MLHSLTIKNFTLVEHLEVDFDNGMTVLTGETGAGKSLTLDALGMALGDRADSDRIRHGADRAEVAADFDISKIPDAHAWLAEHDFDDGEECLLRRIFTREGRSKGYINGQAATMQQLQQFGDLLIDIHSQHEHQSLLRRDTHRKLLDNYGGLNSLTAETAAAFHQWRDIQGRLQMLTERSSELEARRDLLSFQSEEFAELALAEGELATLEEQQKLLSNAEAILSDSHQLASLCYGGEYGSDSSLTLQQGLNQALNLLQGMDNKSPALKEVQQLLTEARIQVEEASDSLRSHIDSFELNPEKLSEIEDRLSLIYQLARKHRTQPELLLDLQQQVDQELEQLTGGSQNLDSLAQQAEQLWAQYAKLADQLSKKRKTAAGKFSKSVNHYFPDLAMTGAEIKVELTPLTSDRASAYGMEQVELLVRTNPGQPHKPLAKVASGGELSRISLAIQVVTAQTSARPTLVFDEVDVGIGGATADVVGALLRNLGDQGQVICVTHLPQVASRAHHHLQVSKSNTSKSTQTELTRLEASSRVEEIARMLGGMHVTDQTLTHAKEMLTLAAS